MAESIGKADRVVTPKLARGTVISILGAESTGKSQLAFALAQRLSKCGIAVTPIGEYLREWCEQEHRTPLPAEQRMLAAEQTRRIDTAREAGLVVADTTSIMTAVYSDWIFEDCSLYDAATTAQTRYTITLLMALDLPWVPDGIQRDGEHVREPVDRLVRAALMRGLIPFTVIHGNGSQRLDKAWDAITSLL